MVVVDDGTGSYRLNWNRLFVVDVGAVLFGRVELAKLIFLTT